MPQKIDRFDGEYAFLSNFYDSPISDCDGNMYPTVEHFFQSMKTLDPYMHRKIAAAPTPGQAKKLGRHVDLRHNWDEIKVNVMKCGLKLKFSIPELKEKLLATGDAYLEEGNWWKDRYWGVCNGIGENMLGKLLMELRDELREKDNEALD